MGQGGLQQIGGGTKRVSADQRWAKEGFNRSEVGQGRSQQMSGATRRVSTDEWYDKEGLDRSEVGMGLNRSVVEKGRHMIYIYI